MDWYHGGGRQNRRLWVYQVPANKRRSASIHGRKPVDLPADWCRWPEWAPFACVQRWVISGDRSGERAPAFTTATCPGGPPQRMSGIEVEEIAMEPEGPNGGPCPTGAPPFYGLARLERASPLEYIDIIPQVLEEGSFSDITVYEKFE